MTKSREVSLGDRGEQFALDHRGIALDYARRLNLARSFIERLGELIHEDHCLDGVWRTCTNHRCAAAAHMLDVVEGRTG